MSEREGELKNTWESAAFNRETNEWVHTTLHSYDHKKTHSLIEPVVPAVITPDRRKPFKRDHKDIFVMGDAQIGYRRIDDQLVPLHDERAIRAARLLVRNLRPDVMVDLGDTTDLAELGKYPVDSDHFQGTLQPSLQRTHDFFAEMTEASPGAERHTVDSNHIKRLGAYVLRNAFPLYAVGRPGEKYPALSYPGLLKLEDIGWEFHGGYGNAEYEYAEDLAFKHGTLAVSNGSTAARLSRENYGRNIVQGHKHSMETHYSTDRRGRMFGAFVVGALCRIDGVVPSYHSGITELNKPLTHYENWQNGVARIRDYGDGNYHFEHIPINDGVIRYENKVYDGADDSLELKVV